MSVFSPEFTNNILTSDFSPVAFVLWILMIAISTQYLTWALFVHCELFRNKHSKLAWAIPFSWIILTPLRIIKKFHK